MTEEILLDVIKKDKSELVSNSSFDEGTLLNKIHLLIKEEIKLESEFIISDDDHIDDYAVENCEENYSDLEESHCDLIKECDKNINIKTKQKRIKITDNDGKLPKCTQCNKTFSHRGNLLKHVKNVHLPQVSNQVNCDMCGRIFKNIDYLRDHQHRSCYFVEKTKYACEWCSFRSNKKSNLDRHKSYVHHEKLAKINSEEFRCELCHKLFPTLRHVKDHERWHKKKFTAKENECEFICDICKKTYAWKSDLTYHIKVHMGIRDFVCIVCKKSYRTSSHLLRHKKSKNHLKKINSF